MLYLLESKYWVIVLFCVVLCTPACSYHNREDLYPVDPSMCETDSLTYDANIKAIFSNNCSVSGCHVSGAQLPVLESYSDVIANLDRIEVRAIEEKTMPPTGPLSSCNQSQLTQWIAIGAPEK